MLVAIGIFRASGSIDWMVKILDPILSKIGMPGEVLPLAIMRPLSGGGANGILVDLMKTHGADSLIGRMAATMSGINRDNILCISSIFWSSKYKKNKTCSCCWVTC